MHRPPRLRRNASWSTLTALEPAAHFDAGRDVGFSDYTYWYDFASGRGDLCGIWLSGYAQNFDTVDFSNADQFVARYNIATPDGRQWVESRSDADEFIDPMMLNPMIGLATDIATVLCVGGLRKRRHLRRLRFSRRAANRRPSGMLWSRPSVSGV